MKLDIDSIHSGFKVKEKTFIEELSQMPPYWNILKVGLKFYT